MAKWGICSKVANNRLFSRGIPNRKSGKVFATEHFFIGIPWEGWYYPLLVILLRLLANRARWRMPGTETFFRRIIPPSCEQVSSR